MLDSRHPRVVLNVSHIRDVEQLIAVGADEIANVAFDIVRPYFLRPDPLRRVIGRVFLVKRVAVNSVRETLKDQRTIEQMRNQVWRDLVVVGNEIALGVTVFWPEDLVQVCEFDANVCRSGSATRRRWRL